jgi:hypothetical protein
MAPSTARPVRRIVGLALIQVRDWSLQTVSKNTAGLFKGSNLQQTDVVI